MLKQRTHTRAVPRHPCHNKFSGWQALGDCPLDHLHTENRMASRFTRLTTLAPKVHTTLCFYYQYNPIYVYDMILCFQLARGYAAAAAPKVRKNDTDIDRERERATCDPMNNPH